jgi:antitoxin HigA-1
MTPQRAPSHPGGILRRLYLEPLRVSVSELADALNVSRKSVSKLVNQRARVTPAMAVRLAIALQTTPHLWLNLQQNYDLWNVQHKTRSLKGVRRVAA